MKLFLNLSFFLLITSFLSAQPISDLKRDYIWLTGYGSEWNNPRYGGTNIDFSTNPPTVIYEYIDMDMFFTNSVISNEEGELLFYTDNISIANFTHEIMENGDELNPDTSLPQDVEIQGTLILPFPESNNLFFLFHEEATYVGDMDGNLAAIFTMYETKIDMSVNGGLGKVLEKNIPLLQDTLCFGKITATRHANGRDWWMIIAEYNSNKFYPFLISSMGIEQRPAQTVGQEMVSGVGQAVFSPDGSKYARLNSVSASVGAFLDIYDFDRCLGVLSNHIRIFYPSNGGKGVAISPNSRYLYVSFSSKVFQYDLWAEDIEESEVLVACFDGYSSTFSTGFFVMQLAPDGKIYIAATNSNEVMHVIHHPDSAGVACSLEQHAFQLPTLNNGTIPNNPNFRLGALEGSSCDTLDINYPAYAGFTYYVKEDTVFFQDQSFYSPTQWLWDFGDGGGSTGTNPTHVYGASGEYPVSLTVSNEYGSDTYSTFVPVLIDNLNEVLSEKREYHIFPNPVSDYLNVRFSSPIRKRMEFILTDNQGKQIMKMPFYKGFQSFKFAMYKLPAGIYFYQMNAGAGIIGSGKLIKK